MIPMMLALLVSASPTGDVKLSLDDALHLAEQNSPTLRRAQADTDGAQARANKALAPLLPQVSASVGLRAATASSSKQGSGSLEDTAFGPSGAGSLGAGVSVHQLLWDFGGAWLRSQAASGDAAGARADLRATHNDTAFAVRSAWFQAAAAEQVAAIAHDDVKNQEEHLAQVEEMVKLGVRSPIDEAQVKTDLANAQAQSTSADAAAYDARLELGRLIGVAGAPMPDDAGFVLGPVPAELSPAGAVLAAALSSRPELDAADRAVTSKQQSLEAARTAYLPTIDAVVSANATGSALDHYAPSASASINLSWNLFDGFGTMNDVSAAESAVASAAAARADVQSQLQVDVQRALSDVKSAQAKLVALESAVDNAKALQELAEGRYRVGTGSIIERDDADLAFVNASVQRALAEAQLSIARAALLHAVGADA